MQAILVSQVFVFLKDEHKNANSITNHKIIKTFPTTCLFTFNFYHARMLHLPDRVLSRNQSQKPNDLLVT